MTQWQKSSFSGGGDGNECVEVAQKCSVLLLRESENPDQVLAPTRSGLVALMRYVRAA
ncbi:DUF397 domain-containing protein [Streptomyces apocyni]|uniref:DUF397 domain-containing protein n=1 Tax=Streptomyces apocyni TaxID=2654677 RepID=UPI0012E99E49|nr:DUF397 domain-containing protein [Streptomyces apocyni]